MNLPTTGQALDQAGSALRLAVERGEFENAQKLLSEYSSEVEKSFRSMPGKGLRIAALANDTRELFDWALREVSAARTQAAADLHGLRSNRSYLPAGRSGVSSWQIEG